MPLNFINRTGRYNLNRNLYVVSVVLPSEQNHHPLQCTLSTTSTGEDCMNYICLRLEMRQNMYFGLRYRSTCTVYRWVDLSKTLRKQLKNAYEPKLYFGVMFHTLRPDLLSDDVARYWYYAQMRADILDGRILGSPEKAILCASYSLQVDYGDYDIHKQTVENLKNYVLIPPHMTQSAQILEGFVKQVFLAHEQLRGMPSSQAAMAYIREAQSFDGYGEEYFSGRDEDGEEVFVGYCINGIIVKRLQGPPVVYGWKEVHSVSAKKRHMVISCAELNHVRFMMEDVETAKYAAYVCSLQLEFHKEFAKLETLSQNDSARQVISESGSFRQYQQGPLQIVYSDVQNGPTPFKSDKMPVYDQKDDIKMRPAVHHSEHHHVAMNGSQNHLNFGGSQYALSTSDHTVTVVPAYRSAPDYESALTKPSLVDYNRMIVELSRQNAINLKYSASFQSLSQHTGQIMFSNEASNLYSALSNPDVMNTKVPEHHNALKPYCPPPKYSRVCSSTPDLTSLVICKSVSSPDLLTKHFPPRLHPIDITMENLSPVGISEVEQKLENQANNKIKISVNMSPPVDQIQDDINYFQRFIPQQTQMATADLLHNMPEHRIMNGPGTSVMKNCQSQNVQRTNDERLVEMEKYLCDLEYLSNEFESVSRKRVSAGMSTAIAPENQDRNNDTVVLPYEDTRVRLTPTKQNPFGYINASFLQVVLSTSMCKYVAAQSPKKKTAPDFWRMIYESGARIIVAMDSSCESYLTTTPKQKLKFDDFHVTVEKTSTSGGHNPNSRLATSVLILKQASTNSKRILYHLHYANWPKDDTPRDTSGILSLLDEVKSVQRLLDTERVEDESGISRTSSSQSGSGTWRRKNSTGSKDALKVSLTPKRELLPFVVHCRTGVDQTGVFVLTNLMINSLEHNENLDVPRALAMLRQQRMHMVSTFEQYQFVYRCLVDYLKTSRLI